MPGREAAVAQTTTDAAAERAWAAASRVLPTPRIPDNTARERGPRGMGGVVDSQVHYSGPEILFWEA